MSVPQACLFDLDGLLLDTEQLHSQAWRLATAKFGSHLNQEQLLLLRGRRRYDCIKQICKWIGKDIEPTKFMEIHQPISKRLMSQAKAMPGAEDLVRFCYAKQLPMALVTSSSFKSLALKSAPHPWLEVIKTKVLGDDKNLQKGKPEPDPFLLAANKLNVNPQECWAFEDSQSGVKSALSAGCLVWILIDEREKANSFDQKKFNPKITFINNLSTAQKELEKLLSIKETSI